MKKATQDFCVALCYISPSANCIAIETIVIPIQQQNPSKIGLPPVFINFTISVLNPIAAIAITMKNFDNSFNGLKTFASTPIFKATVVIILARTKYKINIGNIFLSSTFSDCSCFLVLKYDNTKVIGIIANVLVNFTVTALSNVCVPKLYNPSQVAAAAVTDDVSFTAVPAKIPNASPE